LLEGIHANMQTHLGPYSWHTPTATLYAILLIHWSKDLITYYKTM